LARPWHQGFGSAYSGRPRFQEPRSRLQPPQPGCPGRYAVRSCRFIAGRYVGSPARASARLGANMPAQRIEQRRGDHRDRGDRDRGREADKLGYQLEQRCADSAGQYRSGRAVQYPPDHFACLCAHAGYAGEPRGLRVVPDGDGSHCAFPFTEHDQLRRACLAARRLSVTRPTPLPSASRHRCGTRGPP
jgi:hypothetical protein